MSKIKRAYHWAMWRINLRRAEAAFCRDMEAWRRHNGQARLHLMAWEAR